MIDISAIEPPIYKNANAILQYNGLYFSWSSRVSGYTSGGSPGTGDIIDKFPFSSDGNATDVGNLATPRSSLAGQSSTESGYASGGNPVSSPIYLSTIEKFPFATDGNAGAIGNLTQARQGPAGQSSATHGYSSAGLFQSPTPPTLTYGNTIDKFPFSADGNATDVGDTTDIRRSSGAGQNSLTHGYFSGGGVPTKNIIDRFPFATDANASDVGNLTQARYYVAGQSSDVSGYTAGGDNGGFPSISNIIDKFPFASNANATDVGDLDLTQSVESSAGQSSSISGYVSGGLFSNVIQKFPFATDANATDVGDLTQARGSTAGQQSSS